MSELIQKYRTRNESRYRNNVTQLIDIVRTKGHKYKQIKCLLRKDEMSYCIQGLWLKETGGFIYDGGYRKVFRYFSINFSIIMQTLNDDYGWNWNKIADELEKGINIQ